MATKTSQDVAQATTTSEVPVANNVRANRRNRQVNVITRLVDTPEYFDRSVDADGSSYDVQLIEIDNAVVNYARAAKSACVRLSLADPIMLLNRDAESGQYVLTETKAVNIFPAHFERIVDMDNNPIALQEVFVEGDLLLGTKINQKLQCVFGEAQAKQHLHVANGGNEKDIPVGIRAITSDMMRVFLSDTTFTLVVTTKRDAAKNIVATYTSIADLGYTPKQLNDIYTILDAIV